MTEATLRLSATSLARRIGAMSDTRPGQVRPAASRGSHLPAYRVLADRIRSAVLDGRLAVHTGLPSERELAVSLDVSRTTVALAYSLLRDEGWLSSRRGSGSTLRLPDGLSTTGYGPTGIFGAPTTVAGNGDELSDLTTACLPAPGAPFTAAVAAAVVSLEQYTGGVGYLPFGLPVLRRAIAEHYSAAGLPTGMDQILVTNGAQHGFNLVLNELSAPGDRVMIECPTYPVALDAVRAHRRVPGPLGLSLPTDGETTDELWDLDLIAATLRQTAPRLGYVIPDFQNPTGALMDAAGREHLVTAARRSGTVLVVDESFRDVPFPDTGTLPPPVAAFGDDTQVISLGSVSKSIWGGLRIGWIRAAPTLIDRLATARALGDMAGPVLEQLIVAHLLADPTAAFAEQSARLATGAETLLAALAVDLPDWRPLRPRGGASLWVRLPWPFASELARLAPAAGVRIAPGPRFGPDGTMESYIRMPYTAPVEQLRTATSRLAAVAAQVTSERVAVSGRSQLPGWLA